MSIDGLMNAPHLYAGSRAVGLADLGHGVLDDAMVEVAAYCLEAR